MQKPTVILNLDEAKALQDYMDFTFIPFIQDKDNEVDNIRREK